MSLEALNHLLGVYLSKLKQGEPLPTDGLSGVELDIINKINSIVKVMEEQQSTLMRDKVTLYNILNTIPQGVFWKDLDSNFLGCNKVFSTFVGFKKAADILGKTDYDITTPERAKVYYEEDANVFTNVKPLKDLLYYSPSTGRWTKTQKIPMSSEGKLFGLLGITEDITERKEFEERLSKSELQFRLLAESISEVIWRMDSNLKLTYINPACLSLSGYTQEELLSMQLAPIFPKCCAKQLIKFVSDAQDKRVSESNFDSQLTRKDGVSVWVSCKFKAVWENGVFAGLIGLLSDKTAQKKAEDDLFKQASTDPLTGVFNRRYLITRLSQLILSKKDFWVLILDIDHFKNVNDTYGHPIGDQTLCTFTSLCKECLRDSDLLGRLGGEEFIILLSDISKTTALNIAERIREKIQNCDIIPMGVRITVSIGITSFSNGDSEDTLLKRADTALYTAKNNGRNKIVIL